MREEMAGRVVEVYSLVLAIVSVTCTVYCMDVIPAMAAV